MITRDKALVLADELVRQARDEELARKNTTAAAVPHMYRFPELERLERWERPIVVDEAAKYAIRQPKVLVLWAVPSALLIYLAFTFVRDWPAFSVLASVFTFGLAAAVLMAPFYFYRREVMRAYIRKKVTTLSPRAAAEILGDG
jgi:hypothetical protein